jgi:hypothetical protein
MSILDYTTKKHLNFDLNFDLNLSLIINGKMHTKMFKFTLLFHLLLMFGLTSTSEATITVVHITTEIIPCFCHPSCHKWQPYLFWVSSIASLYLTVLIQPAT